MWVYLQCSKYPSIHEKSNYAQGRISPFLPHLPLLFIWLMENKITCLSPVITDPLSCGSSLYILDTPLHFCHVFCYEQIVQILRSVHRLLAKGYIILTTWGILFYNFLYLYCILQTCLSCYAGEAWTAGNGKGNNEMAAVDKPRTYSALFSRSVASLQTPFGLSGQWFGLLLRNCHCNFCQKGMDWRGLHSISSPFLSWGVVPRGAPSLRALKLCSDQCFCVLQRWNCKHMEKSRCMTKGFWAWDCSLGITGCESRFWLSCLFSIICQLSKWGKRKAIQEEMINRGQGSVLTVVLRLYNCTRHLDPVYSVGFLKSLPSCWPAVPLVGLVLLCQNKLCRVASAFPCAPHALLSPCP